MPFVAKKLYEVEDLKKALAEERVKTGKFHKEAFAIPISESSSWPRVSA
jgi:hypothetical protein